MQRVIQIVFDYIFIQLYTACICIHLYCMYQAIYNYITVTVYSACTHAGPVCVVWETLVASGVVPAVSVPMWSYLKGTPYNSTKHGTMEVPEKE